MLLSFFVLVTVVVVVGSSTWSPSSWWLVRLAVVVIVQTLQFSAVIMVAIATMQRHGTQIAVVISFVALPLLWTLMHCKA